jgi:hypothetical protein
MSWFGNIKDKLVNNSDLKELKSSTLKDILNGNILNKQFFRRQYKLMLLIVVISIIYIDNRYASEKQLLYSIEINKKIQDAKYESLTISAELMEITRQSSIMKMLAEKGIELKQGKTPPVVIE